MSSSPVLITPSVCVCGPPDAPRILITVGVGAKKEGQGGELSGRKWSGVVWSREVNAKCVQSAASTAKLRMLLADN